MFFLDFLIIGRGVVFVGLGVEWGEGDEDNC